MTRRYSQTVILSTLSILVGCVETFDMDQAEAVVKANCKVCHAQGINGAPIIGNQKMWNPRISKGKEALVENAISGVGLMPAKGGKDHLTKAEIELAVEYFLVKLN